MKTKIIKRAEQLNWNCKIEKIEHVSWTNTSVYQVSFQTYSSAGQDVNVELQIKKLSDLPIELGCYYKNYNPESETMLWLDSDGHGKNGAPYHMKDVLADMEEVKKRLGKLYIEISKLFKQQ